MTWGTEAALVRFSAKYVHTHRLAHARWKLAKAASIIALGPTAGRLPETFVRSLVEKMVDRTIRLHVDEVLLLNGAHVEHFGFDAQLGPEYRRSKAFDDRYLYRLRDVRVSPVSGLVWLPDGRVLGESYGSLIRMLGWGRVVEETLLPCTKRIHEPVVALPDTGYYHWLLEVLPAAIHCLAAEPDAAVLVSPRPARYVEEALELLTPRGGVIRSSGPVSADHMVLAAIDPFSGFVPAEDVAVLRERLLPLVPRGQEWGDSIYVSRRGSRRSPKNEARAETLFSDLGFRVVVAEELSFREQVDQFRSASFIAGVHGAGLANQIWSDSLRGVVEILSISWFNDCFARLAVSRGAWYLPSFCQQAEDGEELVELGELERGVRDCVRKQ